ncbi:LytTR family DNA-binding domain-containing protein [Pricia sp.]|uniref:LytTR family DNA-binding domain-containing protein n=1 Tax=Pricia sp. TaxID=2268138 RepID=UPI003593B054
MEIHPRLKKPELWIGILLVVISLSVFQDYLFSRIQNTGFYISESLLYNLIWAFLAPLAYLELRFFKLLKLQSKFGRIVLSVALGGLFTIVHILVFASYFVAVSYFAFSPTHRFPHILSTALSNQFYILVLFYVMVPLFFSSKKKDGRHTGWTTEYPGIIKIKVGLRIVSLDTMAIQTVSAEKPYTVVMLGDKEYLDNRTLRDFEVVLDPEHFVRVHRSSIVNKRYVKELKSRKNGDYDAKLQNDRIIRFSRHYRANWEGLLH